MIREKDMMIMNRWKKRQVHVNQKELKKYQMMIMMKMIEFKFI